MDLNWWVSVFKKKIKFEKKCCLVSLMSPKPFGIQLDVEWCCLSFVSSAINQKTFSEVASLSISAKCIMQEWWVIFASFISFMQTLNDTFWGSESSRVENCHHKWRTLPSTLTLAVDDKQSPMQTKVSKRNVSFNGKMLKVMHSWKGQKKNQPNNREAPF